ncbi:MAG: 2-amino-4-hydroxy-6-hydroxymethyldihydropteridine diphosphokinase [Akkermansiaceae bacterium]
MASRTGIALGTNVGNRLANLREARDLLVNLMPLGTNYTQSGLYQSEPVDCPEDSPDFYNAVVEIDYLGSPQGLLHATQFIEWKLGRQTSRIRNSPRPIDLDILYFDDVMVNEENLILPHPRLTHRRFVLKPLADIHPHLVLPGDETTVGEHLRKLDTDEPDPILVQSVW